MIREKIGFSVVDQVGRLLFRNEGNVNFISFQFAMSLSRDGERDRTGGDVAKAQYEVRMLRKRCRKRVLRCVKKFERVEIR